MSQVLNKVRDVDANNSEAVKEALSAFFQNLLKYKDIDSNRWLRALESVINRFPKYCGTHRPTIEKYLAHFLSANNFYNVIEAAKCAHAVQQVRPLQEKAATAKSCWRDQMAALCDAAHRLIDSLFTKNAGMFSKQNNQNEKTQVTPGSILPEALMQIDKLVGDDNAVNKTAVLCTRLRNVLVYIQAMLVEIYPVAKPIQPQLILRMILQALTAPATEDSANVTTIKIQALRTLDALVACLGSNLIPFSSLVFRFMMQTLKWSSENPSEESSKVRVQAYSSLTKWLDCLHVHRPSTEGRTRAWHDELTSHIVGDVTPAKQIMQLTVNAQPMKNLSKKARKRLANTMLKESNISQHTPGQKDKNNLSHKSNDEVAVAALECAETFLSVCGIFLKTATHKQFQELLVRECFTIQDHTTERAMWLLHALEACRKNCSVKVPPPTQYCLQLYSVLINCPQREISKFCSQALLDIRLQLHCSPASLCFSLEDTQKKDKEEGRKRTTERNRAMLEKLLDIDWMNSENPNVITIPDEPDSKRPRVDPEATENVSISSESVHSVEMSSDDESVIETVELPGTNQVIDEGIHNKPTQVANADESTQESASNSQESTCNSPVSTHDGQESIQDGQVSTQDGQESTQDGQESTKSGQVSTSSGPQSTVQENSHDSITGQESRSVQEESCESNDTEPTQGIKNLAIHDAKTQIDKVEYDAEVAKFMETDSEKEIYEAKTQLNSDTIDGKSPLSMEVAYDYPNTGRNKVKAIDKMDDENLPSTNDTDDIQITCGQDVKSSQDLDVDKSKVEQQGTPKLNGIGKSIDDSEANKENKGASEIVPSTKVLTVEDMLADFVDEINEIEV